MYYRRQRGILAILIWVAAGLRHRMQSMYSCGSVW